MKISLCIGTLLAGATVTALTPAEPGTPAFLKHRPVFHFLARKNWMNDPCAPYYDDATGLYHLFYQSNPQQTVWGNMTWGHAVSHDQATWTDYPDALKNEDPNDFLGVFSGFAARKAVNGKDTVFYTGVTKLPISFKLPYLFGEHVNYATTSDGGKTWQKGPKPVIAEPPSGLNVTGWRDPYVFDSSALDAIYQTSNGHYLITAGGIHDVGPRIFLYHSKDYLNWEYKGFLLAQEKNTSFSPFSGSWGYNFETTNFIHLTDDDGENHNVMMFAAEGIPNRYPMWAIGTLEAHDNCGDNHEGLFKPKMVGVSEYSLWYANAVYVDPKTNKHVVIGWITEDNGFTDEQPQGWNGILSVPREVNIAIVKDIYDPNDKFNTPGDYLVTSTKTLSNGKVVKTIKTLGIKAYESTKLLRGDQIETLKEPTKVADEKVLSTKSKSFELYAEVTSFEAGAKVGFAVRRSDDNSEHTTIVYDDATKKIVINRSASSSGLCEPFTSTTKPNSSNTEGFFHLFDKMNQQGEITREPLRFNVFVDVSVIEVFVNDRFALSARIYPCESASSESNGISLVGPGTFENVKVWGNAKHAWPETRTVPTF